MKAMTTTRRPYILPEALDQVTEELQSGHSYDSALLNVAIRFSVTTYDLRDTYEAKRRADLLAERVLYVVCAIAAAVLIFTN